MRFATLFLALLPLSSFAEEAGHRTCRVLFLGDRDKAPPTLQLFDGKNSQAVDLPRMNLSRSYKLPGGALSLALLQTPVEEGKPAPAGAPTVTVADGVEKFYLLLTPDAANKVAPVKAQVIDASTGNFKAGQMMWYNLTPLEVFGKTGIQPVNIKARSKEVTNAPATAAGDYNVSLSYHIAGDPKTYPICETHWVHDPTSRNLVFLLTDPGSKTPRVVSFSDNPDPEPKPQ